MPWLWLSLLCREVLFVRAWQCVVKLQTFLLLMACSESSPQYGCHTQSVTPWLLTSRTNLKPCFFPFRMAAQPLAVGVGSSPRRLYVLAMRNHSQSIKRNTNPQTGLTGVEKWKPGWMVCKYYCMLGHVTWRHKEPRVVQQNPFSQKFICVSIQICRAVLLK